MSRYEHWIRRYEHRRWTTDDNRMVRPFEWGIEHIGGDASIHEPRAFVRDYAREAIEKSGEWYAEGEVRDYKLDAENVLTFTTPMESPWPENNTVHAQFFPGKKLGPAVLVFPTGTRSGTGRWRYAIGCSAWVFRR